MDPFVRGNRWYPLSVDELDDPGHALFGGSAQNENGRPTGAPVTRPERGCEGYEQYATP